MSASSLGVACRMATTSGTADTFVTSLSTVSWGSVLVMMSADTDSGAL